MDNIFSFSFIGKCNKTEFQCKTGECIHGNITNCNGSCISKLFLNNGIKDCTDGSDEPLTGTIIITFFSKISSTAS